MINTKANAVSAPTPGPLIGWYHQSLLGRGSRHCYGISFHQLSDRFGLISEGQKNFNNRLLECTHTNSVHVGVAHFTSRG